MIRIKDSLVIKEGDIRYRYSRSAGPGGQNVNKLNTRVTLLFNVAGSRCLTDEQKQTVFNRLSTRISEDGLLKVVSQRHRTQRANRRAAQKRLIDLLSEALKKIPVRKATEIPGFASEKRLRRKRHHSEIKQMRKPLTFSRLDQ
jgi:ribosome-associated protein